MILASALVVKKIFHRQNFYLKCTRLWAKNNVLLLKYLCAVDYKIIGQENVPAGNFVAVSKHQSTWECYFLYSFLPNYPVAVSKVEILFLPVFGPALKHIGTLSINRRGGADSMKKILEGSREFMKEGRNVFIVFPQGTRVPVDSSPRDYPYRAGFIGIAKVNKLDILPISLDSGKFWAKGMFVKKSGTITVKIMPPLRYEEYKDMDKDRIAKYVEDAIENNQESV
ncbi:MAG: 1-acyl-sn-glycerol-3-phosphate acyltransferase [Rickettsiales bacterium]|jgi:1-acyl-sn-glycerol-3-phosphate acyltransferase|nr:1-acyl-sn-glycerol-3-phosphate acyltransferase [Rickettsiales bacterium]